MSSQKFGKDCFVEVQFVDVHPMGCSEALTSSDVVQKRCEGESSVHEFTHACCIYIPAQPKVLEFSHHLQKVNILKNTCSAKLIVNFLFNTQPRYVIHAPLDFLRVISIDIMDIITCNAWNQHPSLFTPLPAGASLN